MTDKKIFKKTINKILTEQYEFKKIANVWQRKVNDYWIQIDLQKSNYSNICFINTTIFVEKYEFDKKGRIEYLMGGLGHFTRLGERTEYVDLDNDFDEYQIFSGLTKIFEEHLKVIIQNINHKLDWDKLIKNRLLKF